MNKHIFYQKNFQIANLRKLRNQIKPCAPIVFDHLCIYFNYLRSTVENHVWASQRHIYYIRLANANNRYKWSETAKTLSHSIKTLRPHNHLLSSALDRKSIIPWLSSETSTTSIVLSLSIALFYRPSWLKIAQIVYDFLRPRWLRNCCSTR